VYPGRSSLAVTGSCSAGFGCGARNHPPEFQPVGLDQAGSHRAARRWLVELGIPLIDAIEILKCKAMAFNPEKINGEMPWVPALRRSNRRLLAVGEYCHHAAKLYSSYKLCVELGLHSWNNSRQRQAVEGLRAKSASLLCYFAAFRFVERAPMISLSRRILGLSALLIVSCGRADETTHANQTSTDTTTVARADTAGAVAEVPTKAAEPAQVPLPPPSLTCSPSNFGPNDTLSLRMNVPHGDYLIATQPGDSLFYIIYPQRSVPSRKYSLIPPEGFKQMETLRLPSDVKAVPWYFGRDTTLAPLFPRSGKYVLTMGENLAGDNALGASCTVTFRQQVSR
jgi:hypothetical protein